MMMTTRDAYANWVLKEMKATTDPSCHDGLDAQLRELYDNVNKGYHVAHVYVDWDEQGEIDGFCIDYKDTTDIIDDEMCKKYTHSVVLTI